MPTVTPSNAPTAAKNPTARGQVLGTNAVDFIDQLRYLHLDLLAVRIGIDSVCRLHRKFPDALQNIVDLTHVAFRSLDKRKSVHRIVLGLFQAPNLCTHLL